MKRLDLNGKWKLRWTDGLRGLRAIHAVNDERIQWITATVPGEIHLDLMEAGIIEDPLLGQNCLAARWVEESIWIYRHTFVASQEAAVSFAWITLDGLDFDAKIFLNGEQVGEHQNSFYPCTVDVKGKLIEGENVLLVQLDSGLFGAANKSIEGYFTSWSSDILNKRVWLRKPAYSFGWDWATRLLNVGIFKPVELRWSSVARMEQSSVIAELNPAMDQGAVNIRLFVEGLGNREATGQLSITIAETGFQQRQEIIIRPGKQTLAYTCYVDNPSLWWPSGHGEQSLYTIKYSLVVDGECIHAESKKIGFRKVRINQDPHPDGGSYFLIEINDRPIFAKGANLAPSDQIIARMDRKRYVDLVDRALEAHFNFFRVNGVGLYESEDFYELCDRHGILVWQEFTFSCGSYPTTDAKFMNSVKAEAVFQIRRLANHASLIVWCGNNENEMSTYDMEDGVILPDYSLYHQVLPRLLREEDPQRFYWPSSPFTPGNHPPNADFAGNQHPWGVGIGNNDFRDYRKMACRFPAEGGYLGPTTLSVMESCLPQDQRYMYSFAWQLHNNAIDNWFEKSIANHIVLEWIGKAAIDMPLEQYMYYGGMLQGEALQEYIQNFRRRMFDTASAVFWAFNCCWPAVVGWSIIDFHFNRMPSFYYVRRAFQPVCAVVTHNGDNIEIFGVNDSPNDWRGDIRYGVLHLKGNYPLDRTGPVTLKANTSTLLYSIPMELWQREGFQDTIAFAMLTSQNEMVSRSRLFLPRFRDMNWGTSKIQITRQGEHVIFQCEQFVLGVCLDLTGTEFLADNFFDLWPGMDYALKWPQEKPLPVVLGFGNIEV